MAALCEKLVLCYYLFSPSELLTSVIRSASQLEKQVRVIAIIQTVFVNYELIYWKDLTQINISVWFMNNSFFRSLPFCELNELIHWENSNSKKINCSNLDEHIKSNVNIFISTYMLVCSSLYKIAKPSEKLEYREQFICITDTFSFIYPFWSLSAFILYAWIRSTTTSLQNHPVVL